ncbi:EF-P 5-aminopentanol modification-associated protein YfmH [Metabacillus halosaccharovorans]|uniref:EF-P 5-aminopentanol modification-associated protein YfmH n=1 Tax=Metabacillus halosaccharovorans TaxID=930124 RepID=UPI001C1F3C2D|nr:pitrilysin family protein [Metabacillus halosaccharovorans]MBU7592184.1 insulinase family protein [Metabacillus halosaccharovorans]
MTKPIHFEQLQESLYYEKMDNGLNVYVLPKKGFNKTYATFTTKYGSIDNTFVPINKDEMIQVPDGIAHFLEHKLFEKEDGDVFQQFSKQGASANAFTSFTRTAYLFSSTSQVERNLETLIDFVQEPYFSEKTVEKEKGIIGQEINMYDDNPDWRLYFGLIQNLFHQHPVRIDIAGTIDSIAKITKDSLYECYHTFYHPSNMLLFVVGAVDPDKILQQVRENQQKKNFTAQSEIKREFPTEQETVFKEKEILKMNVQSSKCLVGLKAKRPNRTGAELLKYELSMNILLDMLFSKSSTNHEELYKEGLIDDTFSYDYTEESGFGFAMIGGDTVDPDRLAERIKDILFKAKNHGVDFSTFEATKKKKIGAFLRAINSPEYIANQFTRYAFNEMNLFDVVPTLESLSKEDMTNVLNESVEESLFSVCQVVPK